MSFTTTNWGPGPERDYKEQTKVCVCGDVYKTIFGMPDCDDCTMRKTMEKLKHKENSNPNAQG